MTSTLPVDRLDGGARTQRAAGVAADLRARMAQGVLSFPLTAFTADGELDLDGTRGHVRAQVAAGPAAIFPACGTGEFFSLSLAEYESVVRVAVEEAGGLPVVSGVGYGWAQAVQFAEAAVRAGASAGLLLPHYLVAASQEGLARQVEEVAARTELPLIVYQRGQVKFSARTLARIAGSPTVIGVKDGHSDLDQLQRLRLVAPPDLLFFNGAATAEMQARAYRAIGIPAYSSAVHAFAPEIARAFYAALHADDDATIDRLLREFYWPLVELRDRGTGYAVSLVKAAARLRGQSVGPVRAPLTDPTDAETRELQALLTTGLRIVGEPS
ncbi:5-dehydro-4-deoxyglucarate dehydratase [Geodermatophilus obscurus]|uniref:Probable 5-dehydro-4-deoxyglucarate dehydratase n=1 Tax=Geodermatophilus obscurus TaxID=1861 RepID=A0A1I5CXX5_9ACTN|nr:5-dehydro-4-deoxyglucarate dehydratase [Geodermatophilus obscurus]SFN91809.1 5-dehydro-4-deoxyglucarate dehydratase [Geodermatophilus obscurus]